LREGRAELSTLIATRNVIQHTTLDITLTDNTTLFISTMDILINRFGKVQQYLAKLRPESINEVNMSLDVEQDGFDFQIANVDMIVGQLLTGATRRFDGAEAILGTFFLARGDTLANAIWDSRIPGVLVAGEVGDESVALSFVSAIDAVLVSGRSISQEFPWQAPISTVPTEDPNDIPNPIYDPNVDPTVGRYGDIADRGPGRGPWGRYEQP
jgi:hypothetical protein